MYKQPENQAGYLQSRNCVCWCCPRIATKAGECDGFRSLVCAKEAGHPIGITPNYPFIHACDGSELDELERSRAMKAMTFSPPTTVWHEPCRNDFVKRAASLALATTRSNIEKTVAPPTLEQARAMGVESVVEGVDWDLSTDQLQVSYEGSLL